jgi:hypothetical protein
MTVAIGFVEHDWPWRPPYDPRSGLIMEQTPFGEWYVATGTIHNIHLNFASFKSSWRHVAPCARFVKSDSATHYAIETFCRPMRMMRL